MSTFSSRYGTDFDDEPESLGFTEPSSTAGTIPPSSTVPKFSTGVTPTVSRTPSAPPPPSYANVGALGGTVGVRDAYVRAPGDQDACLAAASKIKTEWQNELDSRTRELNNELRPLVFRHRRLTWILGILAFVSLLGFALVMSWYVPLKIQTDRAKNAPS